ncbi:hypothetical protein AB4525_15685 [Vibrio breoganii]
MNTAPDLLNALNYLDKVMSRNESAELIDLAKARVIRAVVVSWRSSKSFDEQFHMPDRVTRLLMSSLEDVLKSKKYSELPSLLGLPTKRSNSPFEEDEVYAVLSAYVVAFWGRFIINHFNICSEDNEKLTKYSLTQVTQQECLQEDLYPTTLASRRGYCAPNVHKGLTQARINDALATLYLLKGKDKESATRAAKTYLREHSAYKEYFFINAEELKNLISSHEDIEEFFVDLFSNHTGFGMQLCHVFSKDFAVYQPKELRQESLRQIYHHLKETEFDASLQTCFVNSRSRNTR